MSEREGSKKNGFSNFYNKIDFELLLTGSDTPLIVFFTPSESSEWVCTKTVFTNGSVVRGCEKTYTGN